MVPSTGHGSKLCVQQALPPSGSWTPVYVKHYNNDVAFVGAACKNTTGIANDHAETMQAASDWIQRAQDPGPEDRCLARPSLGTSLRCCCRLEFLVISSNPCNGRRSRWPTIQWIQQWSNLCMNKQ